MLKFGVSRFTPIKHEYRLKQHLLNLIILLHPQGFTDNVYRPPRKLHKFYQVVISSSVSLQKGNYRPSPIAKGGLEIVLRATFKIDDSKRSLLHRLKELIEKNVNYELLDESATDEKESLDSDNEEDLSIVFMIDDKAEEV